MLPNNQILGYGEADHCEGHQWYESSCNCALLANVYGAPVQLDLGGGDIQEC